MSNTLLTIDKITRECLRVAHEKATFLGTINRQFDNSWSSEGPTGQTLRIRTPAQYTRTQGTRVIDVQDSVQTNTSLVVATQDHVAMRFNSAELAQSLDEFSKLHIEPAMAVMVSGIESDVLQGVTKQVYNTVGTAGSPPTDLAAIGAARAKLNQALAPKDGNRYVQMDSVTMGGMVNGLKGLFQDSSQIKEQYREGMIGRTGMADFYENERIWTMSNSAGTTPVNANDTIADGATTFTVQTTTTAWAIGQVFTIAGVYDCHPETKAPYPSLKQFTIRATSTATVLQISPTIYITGARKNVCTSAGADVSGALSGSCTLVGAASTSYAQNLMYHKDAFTFATAALPMMGGSASCAVKTFDGLSLRVWSDPDIRNDEMITRIDMLYGYTAIRPQWACRITS